MIVSAISTAPLAGTYTFEFGEDGVSWPISIPIHVDDFSTIRFRQLLNAGEYFRVQFEPDAPLLTETIFLTSQLSKTADPPFVVPSGHVFEEADAAFGVTWNFQQAFDANGLSHTLRCNPTGQLINADFLIEAAKGNVPGHCLLAIAGTNADVDSSSPETIWLNGGLFTPPTVAGVVTIVSTSALDTAAGTGAREVTVMGLDATGAEQTVAYSTLGTTDVVSTELWSAINEVYVSDAGALGENQGTITGVVTLQTMFGISPGTNQTALGFATVPLGKKGFVLDYSVSQSNQSSSELYAYPVVMELGEPARRRKHFGAHSQGGSVNGDFKGSLVLPERSFIRWDAEVSANNNRVSCTTNILLVDNDLVN